jgi:hypothetical protein
MKAIYKKLLCRRSCSQRSQSLQRLVLRRHRTEALTTHIALIALERVRRGAAMRRFLNARKVLQVQVPIVLLTCLVTKTAALPSIRP